MDAVVTLAIVGDVSLVEPLPKGDSLDKTFALLRAADIAFGNMEVVLSARGERADKIYAIRADPGLAREFRSAGFSVMGVANNHTLDYGPDAFLDTLEHLRAEEISVVGGGRNLQEAWNAAIIETNELRVAFVAASCTLPPGSAAGEDRPGIAPIHVVETFEANPTMSLEQPGSAPFVHTRVWPEDEEAAAKAVMRAKAQADFVVVSIHWGVGPLWQAPFQGVLAEYQQPLAHRLLEAGADMIAGHHPHSLQPVEVYKGRPIFYSLGNFLFHPQEDFRNHPMTRNAPYKVFRIIDAHWSETVIVSVKLRFDGAASYEIRPVVLDNNGNPQLLDGDRAQTVFRHLAQISQRFGTSFHHDSDRAYLVLP